MKKLGWLCCALLLASSCDTPDDVVPGAGGDAGTTVVRDPVYVEAPSKVLTTHTRAIGDNYFGAMWPDDRRLDQQGYFVISQFPNPGNAALLDAIATRATRLFKGWGLASPVFVPFDAEIDLKTLPTSPALGDVSASIFLIRLDASVPGSGEAVPLEWRYEAQATLFLPGNVLAARPVVGYVLQEGARYAFVVTSSVKDVNGAGVGPEEAFFKGLRTRDPSASDEQEYLLPLKRDLEARGFDLSTVAGATVFTTQSPFKEILQLKKQLEADVVPSTGGVAFAYNDWHGTVYQGFYTAPNFMQGRAPYESEGGEFVFASDGSAEVAAREEMRFTVCIPNGAMPVTGWPVVFYSHGTGGDFETVVDDASCRLFNREGIAVFGIDNVLHGPRSPPGATCQGSAPEGCFFNVGNPVAGRNLLRQAALDHVSLRRMAANLTISAPTGPQRFDTRRFGFFGHSQGGLTGAIYGAIEDDLVALSLSGSGGHITTTILERPKDASFPELPTALEAVESLVFNIAGRESLHQLHPGMALLQMAGEAADPLVYGPRWHLRPVGQRKNVFLINGQLDDQTPLGSSEAYALSGGVPQFQQGAHANPIFPLLGLSMVSPPLSGNAAPVGSAAPVTAAVRQFPEHGHFAVFYDSSVRRQLAHFMRTALETGVATIPAPD